MHCLVTSGRQLSNQSIGRDHQAVSDWQHCKACQTPGNNNIGTHNDWICICTCLITSLKPRMEKTTLFHVFLFTDKVGPLLIGITTLSCLLDNPEWGEFWIFCWLAMNTSQTPSHVPTFPSVSPLTVSNYPSGPMALHPTRIHWCAAIKSRAQLHSTAHLHSAQLHRQRPHDRDRLRGLARYCECHSEHSEAFGAFPTALM